MASLAEELVGEFLLLMSKRRRSDLEKGSIELGIGSLAYDFPACSSRPIKSQLILVSNNTGMRVVLPPYTQFPG
jgi:hypothetical protein